MKRMDFWWNLPESRKYWVGCIVLVVMPLFLNVFVWKTLVTPSRVRLEAAYGAKIVTELRPGLEKLLRESDQTIAQGMESRFTQEDPSRPLQLLQKLATQHHVQFKEISSRGEQITGTKEKQEGKALGTSGMLLELEVLGSFGRLVRWIRDVEKCLGLTVDSWKMTPATDPTWPHNLNIQIKVSLQ